MREMTSFLMKDPARVQEALMRKWEDREAALSLRCWLMPAELEFVAIPECLHSKPRARAG